MNCKFDIIYNRFTNVKIIFIKLYKIYRNSRIYLKTPPMTYKKSVCCFILLKDHRSGNIAY